MKIDTPVVRLQLPDGLTKPDRKDLLHRLREAAATQGVALKPYDACDPLRQSGADDVEAITVVRNFLNLLEARDLAGASALLAEGAVMIFPGGVCFRNLEQLIAWSQPRYRKIAKDIEVLELANQANDSAVVYCYGTLFGEWPNGKSFSKIRFIDRFLVSQGKILRQMVWNDLAVST